MDREGRRFGNEEFNNRNNRRFNNDEPYSSNYGDGNDGQFEQPYQAPQFGSPTPIRRSGFQVNQNFQQNSNVYPNQGNPATYPGQPAQFTIPYNNQSAFVNNTDEGFDYDYNNQSYQRESNMDMAKKKRGFFSFMNKKEEQPVQQNRNNVVITYPKNIHDITTVIDGLRNGHAIIVDFSKVGSKINQRPLDYLSGAVYALHGSQQCIGENMFLLTPEGVCIQGPTEIKKRYDK